MITSDYTTLPTTARVWIYQAKQGFPTAATPLVREKVQRFTEHWISHNRQLRAYGDVWHDRFVVLMVDESKAGASGCSIDSSVRFLKQLQMEYGVDLFDRMVFAYQDGDTVKALNRDDFAAAYRSGAINDQTIVFDTLVKTKGEFDSGFQKPLGKSWHARLL